MIPVVNDDLVNDFELEQEPSRTYKLHLEKKRISGYIDNLEAVKQAVYVILNTERYEYLIYSWDFGVELNDLYGQPIAFVIPELKRRITEALTQDDRIESVDAFHFETSKGKVHATFTVHSSFGDFEADRVVNI
ncbi:DUF2634 domain-containing protein [Robertmurraya sp. FSL W8-0741]|uniref:DUF2634 domain-containing protein n=1 Tax=Robertmurraya sp. FSL W8-0741 TaxID=2954629 RepID=UPI0030F98402